MNDDTIFLLVILAFIALIYCIPAIVAFSRHHPNRWLIFAINVCLGGTGIVWFVCLIWAFHKVHDPEDSAIESSPGGESGLNVFANDVKAVRLVGGSADSHRSDYLSDLERLATLREKGILDEEEFLIEKKKLLG